MDAATRRWQPPQAWRDGDELVFRLGAPLPPICVFCGAVAVAGIRNAINTRGRPIGSLQVLGARLPACERDARRHRQAVTRANVTVVVVFLTVLLTGVLPGILGVAESALNPFGGTVPGAHALLLAFVVYVGARLVRFLVAGARDSSRPVKLRYDRSEHDLVWLHGADPRCLAQLPPVIAR